MSSNQTNSSIILAPITWCNPEKIPSIPSTAQVCTLSAGISRTVSIFLTEQTQIDSQCHTSASQGSMGAFMCHYSPLNKIQQMLALRFVMR
jgi:hypothetical protein